MNLKLLKIRDKLTCKLADGDGSEYSVLVEEVVDEEYVLTDLPIVLSGKVYFRINTMLDIIYVDKNGVFYFQGRVIEFTPDKNFMLIRRIGTGGRIQRRNYFRLEVNLTCQTRCFSNFFSYSKKSDSCIVDNISAGGIKIMTNEHYYQPGDLYYIHIDNFAPLKSIWAEVLMAEKVPVAKNVAFINYVALRFAYINSKESDELVRQLMIKQREQSRINTVIN